MTRAQTLGIMAANVFGPVSRYERDALPLSNEEVAYYVAVADALLREAERVSPEPVFTQHYGSGLDVERLREALLDARPSTPNITVAPLQRPNPIDVPENPR